MSSSLKKQYYDPKFGDSRECLCGCQYWQHFDLSSNIHSYARESDGCENCVKEDGHESYGHGYCSGFKELDSSYVK